MAAARDIGTNGADDFAGVFEIAAAGSGHHHPGCHQRLADVVVGVVGLKVFEEGGGGRLLDRAPDFHVALEDEFELLAGGA